MELAYSGLEVGRRIRADKIGVNVCDAQRLSWFRVEEVSQCDMVGIVVPMIGL